MKKGKVLQKNLKEKGKAETWGSPIARVGGCEIVAREKQDGKKANQGGKGRILF